MEIVGKMVDSYGASGEFMFSQAACTDGTKFYLAKCSEYSTIITAENVEELPMVLIPSEHFQPAFDPEKHSLVAEGSVENSYVKIPPLTSYNSEDEEKLNRLVLHEVGTLEVLKRSPHPNVIAYLGCKVKGNGIVGICLEKLEETLDGEVKRGEEKVDKEKVLDGIRSGLKHLHALGYCHNDISPANIMFRKDGTPVIIDFDSCQPTGHELGVKRGTRGYRKENVKLSLVENDFFSLEKIGQFIVDGDDPIWTSAPPVG